MRTDLLISSNQNYVIVNGQLLEFYQVKKVKKNHCAFCWLLKGVECFNCYAEIPCGIYIERFDKKVGVFSIREMPEINDLNN